VQAEKLEIWTDVPGIFTADPRVVPHSYLLQRLSFSEAQELASMGAKILHPPSVRTCSQMEIPIQIRDTTRPDIAGTQIGPRTADTGAGVKGIVSRKNITLVMMDNPSMWRQVGFLASAFDLFRRHGLSVDLVSTSESSVTVSLDPGRAGADDSNRLDGLIKDLSLICEVQLRTQCVSISLVGNAIRTILGRLSEALDVFQDRKVHMVTQSANDLNLTLVVDAEHADRLVRKLHELLITPQADQHPEIGVSWQTLTSPDTELPVAAWWRQEAGQLLRLASETPAAYVYHLGSVRNAAKALLDMQSVSRIMYAVKANDHPAVLTALYAEGTGFDCVSMAEIRHVLDVVPGVRASDLLFTPNFAGRDEYRDALALGAQVTVDNIHPLVQWPGLFTGQDVFLRVDLDVGYGHHKKVVTSGSHSKFGISIDQLKGLLSHLEQHDINVSGLHAHTGSGVHDARVWAEQLRHMLKILPVFPSVKVLDLGGGLGVPDRAGQPSLDVQLLDQLLGEIKTTLPLDLWLEPGRYLVAQSGVLLARVTQVKSKGQYHYLGLETGMNSLIRPALYGAYHDIVNLTRLDQPARQRYSVVGPICESGDILGESRFLPESAEGDIILIANAGAYGRVMSSHYNRRAPAPELIFEEAIEGFVEKG
jgi:diaminopimelate decarboxylase/aspartate kinase